MGEQKSYPCFNLTTIEVDIIRTIPGSFTAKDALLQLLVWENSHSIRLVTDLFDIEGDPALYFREDLTETPGYGQAREQFENALEARLELDPNNKALQKARVYLASYE